MSKMYYQGETMRQNVSVRDVLGILVDPAAIEITIIDPDGTVMVDAEAMTKGAVGKYLYNYLIAEDAPSGEWKTEVKADSGYIAIEQDKFTVMEAL